ncbi:MAG: hypothetical protein ABSD46_02315 [Bacteroidota bacterium]
MERKEFIQKCSACGVLSLLSLSLPDKQLHAQVSKTNNNKSVRDAHREQITKLLSFVDGDMDESIKQKVFGKLGYECFYCTNAVKWIKSMTLTGLIEFVNNGNSSRWEKIQYDSEKSVLKVIGRKLPCDCAYAQGQQPQKSLCNYCCKSFMQEFFGTLFKEKVKVIIDETIILGGERCSETIKIC